MMLLLSAVVATAQNHPPCGVLLKADAIFYAGTKDEKSDSITVCDDGNASGAHSFSAPALGDGKSQPDKWTYRRNIGKETTSDLLKFLRSADVVSLPESLNLVKPTTSLEVLMHFTTFDRGNPRTVTIRVPAPSCGDNLEDTPKAVYDLMCMFSEVSDRVKTGVPPPEGSCGCKSIHEMAGR